MRIPRIILRQTLLPGTKLDLPKSIALHLIQVLRLDINQELIIMDGQSKLAHAKIISINKREVTIIINDLFEENKESPLHITLWQCLSKGDRMDYTLQKAVELGVSEIVPVMSERVNLRLDSERLAKRYDHWQGVIDSAAAQSCRTVVPILQSMQHLQNIGSTLAKKNSLRLVLDPKATQTCKDLTAHQYIDLLIGSEGGLSEQELLTLKQAGFIGIKLGPRVLRTETAGLVILSLLQGQWGDLAS